MILSDNDLAIDLAEAIERQFTDEDGELLRPMRVAKARATKATAVAWIGDLDEATRIGESVYEIERQGIPGDHAPDNKLADLLAEFRAAQTFRDRRRDLMEISTQ